MAEYGPSSKRGMGFEQFIQCLRTYEAWSLELVSGRGSVSHKKEF